MMNLKTGSNTAENFFVQVGIPPNRRFIYLISIPFPGRISSDINLSDASSFLMNIFLETIF